MIVIKIHKIHQNFRVFAHSLFCFHSEGQISKNFISAIAMGIFRNCGFGKCYCGKIYRIWLQECYFYPEGDLGIVGTCPRGLFPYKTPDNFMHPLFLINKIKMSVTFLNFRTNLVALMPESAPP